MIINTGIIADTVLWILNMYKDIFNYDVASSLARVCN